jgi:4-oxalmesaconate hydratase
MLIIDCHEHYNTAPKQLAEFRKGQIAGLSDPHHVPSRGILNITDDEIRETLEPAQLKWQIDRGTDVAIFSPLTGAMSHHIGNATTSLHWAQHCNDLVYRVTQLYPKNFVGVCQLPQSPGVSPANCVDELTRCVEELGFVGLNLNIDPSDGYWTEPPLSDRWWYPLYERMVELDVPAMIHTSGSCNPNFQGNSDHYLNGDTTAFMQFMMSNLFTDFPTIKFIIPHGGGAVPYHWGRYRGVAHRFKLPPLREKVLNNVYFDTCVYHQAGIDLLTKVIPVDNIIFGAEPHGPVRDIDPETGHHYDDTKRYIDAVASLSDADRYKIFEGNARKVYSRLSARLDLHHGHDHSHPHSHVHSHS